MLEQIGTNTWNEMSYKRYENRTNERTLDVFEIEEKNTEDYNKETIQVNYYGTFEDITKKNCFGVDEVFYLNYEE